MLLLGFDKSSMKDYYSIRHNRSYDRKLTEMECFAAKYVLSSLVTLQAIACG